MKTLSNKLKYDGPQTDDELHAWVKINIGVDIPRVAVCEDHCAPFDLLADLYFERVHSALAMANRGGSKTFIIAVLHFLNSTYKPGCESLSFGATEAQGNRCVAEDTLVDCPRDHRRFPLGVPITQVKPGQLVWTLNESEWKFELRRALNVWKTGRRFIWKVTLDDGSVLRTTKDHRYMRRDGSWAELRDLSVGDSLMPMYRDFEPYVKTLERGRIKEYYAVAHEKYGYPRDGVVHHADNSHMNTSEGNLELIDASEHGKLHAREFWDAMDSNQRAHLGRKMSEGRKALGEALIKELGSRGGQSIKRKIDSMSDEEYAELSDQRKASALAYYESEDEVAKQLRLAACSEAALRSSPAKQQAIEAWKAGRTRQAQERRYRVHKQCSKCNEEKPLAEFYMYKGKREFSRVCAECAGQVPANHKIVAIEFAGIEDVWDMAVEGNHNFVAHGIVIHNCYGHLEDWCYKHGEDGRRTDEVHDFIKGKPMKSETVWRSGSKVEVVAGTESAVSGPHPAKGHADEIEQMDNGTWQQSRGMVVTNRATGDLPPFMEQFGGMIPPQDIATSTRNSTKGRMQELLDEIAEDLRNDNIPQFQLYQWCIWETVQEVPTCRAVSKPERDARLKELGKPLDTPLCNCNRVNKGIDSDGTERTLEKVCKGRAFRARGWKPVIDLIQTFKRNTPGTWSLQHECREGQSENNYIENWSLNFYGVRNYEPHPLYGPIYMGVDWGTTHPACVLWFQHLTSEVPGMGFEYEPVWLQPNVYILFKEIYVSGIATETLAQRVIEVEKGYRAQFGAAWNVKSRFCDPQGAGDRITFNNYGLRSTWPVRTRNKERMIDNVVNLVTDDRIAVDVDQCKMFTEEIESWQRNAKTGKELDTFNHAMAAWRYGISNAEVLESQNRGKQSKGGKATRNQDTPVHQRRAVVADSDRRSWGEVASVGGSQAPMNPAFTLPQR